MTSQVWKAGTATVSSGSAIVSGSGGTGWLTAAVAGGLFVRGGFTAVIESVESETALTLAQPWGGSSGSGTYAIQRATSEAADVVDLYDRLAKALITLSLAGIHPHGIGALAKRDSLVLSNEDEFIFLRAELGQPFEYYVWDGPTDESWLGPFPVAIPGDDGTDGVQSSDNSVTDIITLTQAEYDLLTPDPTTFYIIKEDA